MKQPMNLKKRTILQNVLIFLFAAAALFSALLTVLSLIPQPAGLTVREEVTATASRMSMDNPLWQVEVRGRLRNTSDQTITVEKLTVTVKGNPAIVLEKDSFTLAPRADLDLILSATSDHAAEGTPTLTAVIDGKTVYLRNPADTPLVATMIPLALTILLAFLTVRAVKVRIYLKEEKQIVTSSAALPHTMEKERS